MPNHLKKYLPLVILPCSADKLSFPAKAIDLYKGKGYLPVLNNRTRIFRGQDYQLAFMSAKLGLVMADEIIEPYELKMSQKQSDWLVEHRSKAAIERMDIHQPSRIVACLPKLYLSTFEKMVEGYHQNVFIAKPDKGSGIGLQRQFLSNALKRLTPKTASFFLFHNLAVKQHHTNTVYVTVGIGDVFSPWLGNTGDERLIGELTTVKDITSAGGVDTIISDDGKEYSTVDIYFGLSDELRQAAKSYGGFYEPGMDLSTISAPLSQIQQDVLKRNIRAAA